MNRHVVPNAVALCEGPQPHGGSEPLFLECDDGVARIVKWHPSPHGPKACYNELVASRLGLLIGSPVVRGGIVYVPDRLVPEKLRSRGVTAGQHFGAARLAGESISPLKPFPEIANRRSLAAACLHLAWLMICDHAEANQFLEHRRGCGGAQDRVQRLFRLIDLGQMFGDFSWTPRSLPPHTQPYHLPAHLKNQVSPKELRGASQALLRVTTDEIADCLHDRPRSWAIPDADVRFAQERVTARRDQIEAILRC